MSCSERRNWLNNWLPYCISNCLFYLPTFPSSEKVPVLTKEGTGKKIWPFPPLCKGREGWGRAMNAKRENKVAVSAHTIVTFS